MEIKIDRNIYSDNVISKVVYWLSEKYTVKRRLEGNMDVLSFSSNKNLPEDEKDIHDRIYQMLNDQKLRDIIEIETKDIRTILYAKAFADFDDLTEEDLTE